MARHAAGRARRVYASQVPRDRATDPRFRRLMAQIADTEWQIVECEFQNALMRGTLAPPVLVAPAGPPPDPAPLPARRVSVATRYELNYWMMTFRASEAELRDAIIRVGTRVSALKAHFARP